MRLGQLFEEGKVMELGADGDLIHHPGPYYDGDLEGHPITAMFVYHLDGHVYARTAANPGGVVRVTEPMGWPSRSMWVVAQGWSRALTTLLGVRPTREMAIATADAVRAEHGRMNDQEFAAYVANLKTDSSIAGNLRWFTDEYVPDLPDVGAPVARAAKSLLIGGGLLVLGVLAWTTWRTA